MLQDTLPGGITKGPSPSTEGVSTGVIVLLVVLVLVGLLIVALKYRKALMRALGLRTDMESMAAKACKNEKELYTQLGFSTNCEKPKCATLLQPDENNGCKDPGFTVSKNASGVNCCSLAADAPADPTSFADDMMGLWHEDGIPMLASIAIHGVLMHAIKKKVISTNVGTNLAKKGLFGRGSRNKALEKTYTSGEQKASRTLKALAKKEAKGELTEAEALAKKAAEKKIEEQTTRAAEHKGEAKALEKATEIAEKKAVEKGLEKAGAKLGASLAKDLVEDAAVGATICAATALGTAGIGCAVGAVVSVVSMLFTVAEIAGDVLDVSGTGQYLSNENDVLAARDLHEGVIQQKIKESHGTSKPLPGAPFLFSLDQLAHLPGYKTLSDKHPLKELCLAYQSGHMKYMTSKIPDFTSKLSKDMLQDIVDSIAETGDPPEDFMKALLMVGSQTDAEIKQRDEAIWKTMSSPGFAELAIKGNVGRYVMYEPSISGFREKGDESGKMHCGISLNEAGAELLNKEIHRTKGKEKSLHPIIFSRYYRLLSHTENPGKKDQKHIMVQKALPVPFPQVSNSRVTVEMMCTDGFDQKALLAHYPIQGAIDLLQPPDLIRPGDYLVTYDQDTGVCKYGTDDPTWRTNGYCAYMGGDKFSSEAETKKFKCEGSGCDKSTYEVCKPLDGLSGALAKGFGFVEAEFIVTDARRSVDALEAWVDPDGSGMAEIDEGGLAGAAAGAVLGSAIFPGVGTLIGGIAGGMGLL